MRLVSIECWIWLVLGLLFIGAGIGMVLYPRDWITAVDLPSVVTVRDFGLDVIILYRAQSLW